MSNFHGQSAEFAVDVVVGGFAFHRCGECEDYFFDTSGFDTVDQRVDFEEVGSDSVDRGYDTSEDVVKAVELSGVFDAEDVFDGFDDADCGGVTCGVCADWADVVFGDVVAD